MHLQKTFLAVNGFGYLLLGLWCALAPEYTSYLVGFTLNGSKGLAEYVAVYGGLEFGIGAFYLLCLRTELQTTAVLFSVCLYTGIVLFRSSAMVLYN